VPSIFLAQTQDEKLLIIDGYQRVMTVRDYVRGIFSGDEKPFSLSRTEKINKRWRGKQFAELTEAEQRKIKNTTIHAIIFAQQKEPQNEDTSLFQVFERINTSGRTLTAQEIRNCVAQGRFNKLLIRLNEYPVWRDLFGLDVPEPRMRDMEYILRFFALSSEDFKSGEQERLSLRQFLDVFIRKHSNLSQQQEEDMEVRFKSAIDLASSLFGNSAFHNISPSDNTKYVQKFSPTIFDSILIAIDSAIQRGISNLEGPQERKTRLLQDERYRFVISKETMRRSSIKERINKVSNFIFGVDYE